MIEKRSEANKTDDDMFIYYLLTNEEAFEEMDTIIREINDVLGLSSISLVRMILNKFRWDKHTVTEQFYENPDRIFEILKVPNPYVSPSLQWDPRSPGFFSVLESSADEINNYIGITCRTCCIEKKKHEFHAFACRHQHCVTCCKTYVEWAITQGQNEGMISCPSRCNQIIDEEIILKLISDDAKLCQRYRRHLLDSFVQSNHLTRWCPGKGCETVVKLQNESSSSPTIVNCDNCGTTFCFNCGQECHEPLLCSLLEEWNNRHREESLNNKWLLANTKSCPKCHSNIEKNGGCNHMTCRKPGCQHEFCWLCLDGWRNHNAQACNVYQQRGDTKQSQAQHFIEQYHHYFSRYEIHDQSLRLENRLIEKLQQRQQLAEELGYVILSNQTIKKALNILEKCRRTLKYSYPFAFFLERNNEVEIFERNQADLAEATEALSGLLEKDEDTDENSNITILNKAVYCEQRRQALLAHCQEGYTNGYWINRHPFRFSD